MHTTPLGKLLLRARQIGEELNIYRPSELLKLVVEPPSLLQLEHALQELLFIGAIVTSDNTKVTEDSDITLLGKFSLVLPIDLELCRLVFYSLCFGCPVEGIIMAAAISNQQDVFTMPSRILIDSMESYRIALKRSLKTRFQYDDGIHSDLIVICRLYRSLLQFCIDNSLKFTKGLNKFCVIHSTSYQRLHSLVRITSSLADAVLNFIDHDRSNPMYGKIYLLTKVTASYDMSEFNRKDLFCEDERMIQSVILASFVTNIVVGNRKIDSNIVGERKSAIIGRDIIDQFDFQRRNSLVSKCNRKLTDKDLKGIVEFVCPDSTCKVVIDGMMCAVEVTNLYQDFDVPLLWQFGERRSTKMDDGTPYPNFFSPYELTWNRIHGNCERVNLLGWRNKTGCVCEFSTVPSKYTNIETMNFCDIVPEAPPVHMGVVSTIQGSESTEFVRGKYLTILPSLMTDKLILLLLAFQPFYVSVQLRNNGKCITAMKLDLFNLDFEKWQVLTVKELKIINKLRRVLSKVIGCTDNKHSWSEVVPLKNLLQQLLSIGGDESLPDSHESEFNMISCEFYPQYKSSLVTDNFVDEEACSPKSGESNGQKSIPSSPRKESLTRSPVDAFFPPPLHSSHSPPLSPPNPPSLLGNPPGKPS
jgi:hypothetical protein